MEAWSKETLIEAFNKYFMQHFADEVIAVYPTHWDNISSKHIHEFVTKAIEKTSKDMDDIKIEHEVTDHCVHWLLVATLPSDSGPIEIEVPLNRVSTSELNIGQLDMFFAALVKNARSFSTEKSFNMKTISEVSKAIEGTIDSCDGCKACISLSEARFSRDNVYFSFIVKYFDTALTVEAPWPR